MKSKIILSLVIGFQVFNYSCKSKEEVLKPLPIVVSSNLNLDTIWRAKIGGYSNNPVFNSQGNILMSKVFDNPEGEIFKLFDGVTGKLKWEWHDYFSYEEEFSDNSHCLINDIMVLCAENNTYAFSTITGKTIWRSQMINLFGEPTFYKDNDGYIYQGYIDAVNNYQSHVYRTKYDEGKWEKVCSYEDSSKTYDHMYSTPAAFSSNSKGEKMMVYTMYLASKTDNTKVRAKVFGYNLNTKKFDWIKDYTDKYIEFNVCNMQSANGKVFTFAVYGAKRYLVAINAEDGTIVWDQLLPDFGVGMYLYQNKIIVLSNGKQPVAAYDINSGEKQWQQNFTSVMLANMNFTFGDSKVFKNYLMSTQCDYLLALNLDNGQIVYFKKIAISGGCLQFGLEVNEEKRCFYVQDRTYVVCYKLPDEIK